MSVTNPEARCVNQLSVDDYVGTILTAWYTRAALWTAEAAIPGAEPACSQCSMSPLSEIIEVREWPHALIHHLTTALASAVGHISISVCEDCEDGAAGISYPGAKALAREMALASLQGRSAEIAEVLEDCVRYRLDDREVMEFERLLLGH